MTNEHYLEVAKECGFDMMTIAPSIVIDAEQLDAYTSRICAERDAAHAEEVRADVLEEVRHFKRIRDERDVLKDQLSAANAAIAIKDSILKDFFNSHSEMYSASPEGREYLAKIQDALSTSPESVAAWEEQKLLPLRRQVAMLAGIVSSIHNEYLSKGFIIGANALKEILSNTQATAEAYERERAEKVLEKLRAR